MRTGMGHTAVSAMKFRFGKMEPKVNTLKQSYKEATFQTHFLFLSQVQNCTIFCQKTCLLSK